jgi:hypothetical protein
VLYLSFVAFFFHLFDYFFSRNECVFLHQFSAVDL